MGLSALLEEQRRFPEAAAAAEQALRLFQKNGNKQGVAQCLRDLGNVERYEGRAEGALDFWERSAALYRDVGDEHGVAEVLNNIGELAVDKRDYARGAALLAESREILRRLGDDWRATLAEHNLALAALGMGNLARAAGLFGTSLKRSSEIGSHMALAYGLVGMAAATAREDPSRAVRLLSAADSLLASIGSSLEPLEQRVSEETLSFLRGDVDPELFAEQWHLGAGMTPEEAVELALRPR